MSNREKCISILDSFTDTQLTNIVVMLQAARDAITEAADDAFCHSMLREYEADPDKGEFIGIEEAASQLGISL